MSGNRSVIGSDLVKVDAYENTVEDYEEIPDMSDADPSLVTWSIGDRVVSEVEGRAAMRAALAGQRERIDLDLPGNVLAAFRVGGPDWRDRMVDALKKAAGL